MKPIWITDVEGDMCFFMMLSPCAGVYWPFCKLQSHGQSIVIQSVNNNTDQKSLRKILNQHTMPAKSLGTLAMIYAIVELQNPLPRKTMLWKGDMNVSASTSDTFLQR